VGVGVSGGFAVFHPLRVSDLGHEEYHACVREGYRGSLWEWVRECDHLHDPRYVVEGPHFHVIGCGWSEASDISYKRTGWVIKRIGSLENKDAVGRCLTYILGHSGYVCEDGHATDTLTWFGGAGYRNMRCEHRFETYAVGCPECGCAVYEHVGVVVLEDGSLDLKNAEPLGGIVYARIKVMRYWFGDLEGVCVLDEIGHRPPEATHFRKAPDHIPLKGGMGNYRLMCDPCL